MRSQNADPLKEKQSKTQRLNQIRHAFNSILANNTRFFWCERKKMKKSVQALSHIHIIFGVVSDSEVAAMQNDRSVGKYSVFSFYSLSISLSFSQYYKYM